MMLTKKNTNNHLILQITWLLFLINKDNLVGVCEPSMNKKKKNHRGKLQLML